MYELWVHFECSWTLRGQYPTRKAAIAVGKDYLSRGFRSEVRHEEKTVWSSGYSPRCASR